jgi:hypothetical protein
VGVASTERDLFEVFHSTTFYWNSGSEARQRGVAAVRTPASAEKE